MPRRAYIADLQRATAGLSVANISNVKQGSDDGEFKFECVVDGTPLTISALIADVSSYPSEHSYMLFTDDAPASVAGALEDIAESASGQTIADLLQSVSKRLSVDRDGDHEMIESQLLDSEEDEDEDEDEIEEYDEDDFDYFASEDEGPRKTQPASAIEGTIEGGSVKATPAFRRRYRSDLRAAESSGFKVGVLGSLREGGSCYVSVSCRISKLGISTEAMQAWHVEPSEYFVVIFHYPNGYKSMDDLKSQHEYAAARNLVIRVGVCTSYKPSLREAIRAFTVLSKEDEMRKAAATQSQGDSHSDAGNNQGLRACFISRPLNELFNRFWKLVSLRERGMTWGGAEMYFNDSQGASHVANANSDLPGQKYGQVEDVAATYSSLVTADHLTEAKSPYSLPLVGMQFALRHFVRCTEFCLVCFDKLPEDVQAIKPYVCNKDLCLYQYISLGFGPSLEHEILTQPKVVDLLVSFCYVRASQQKLVDFPKGLNIVVPPSLAYTPDYYGAGTSQAPQSSTPDVAMKARYNESTDELMFPDQHQTCPLRVGDWIVIRGVQDECNSKGRHCRVAQTAFWPTLKLGKPVMLNVPTVAAYNPGGITNEGPEESSKEKPPPSKEFLRASIVKYSQDFDKLDDREKCSAICAMLDILPPISELQQYIMRHSLSSLSSWVDQIPAGLLAILRWVVASNRACILQVDEGSKSNNGGDWVWGMPGWTQFRFAMGAPDKELQFIQAVNATKARLKLNYETLFAWHGSPLHNWHSIIRQGLRFDYTAHGRAYGHGVYHSQDLYISMGYSSSQGYGWGHWKSSELKVCQAVALNEIVNAPKEYISSSPHLVVQHLDWIQTRYLFVKGHDEPVRQAIDCKPETKPTDFIEQDPGRSCRGLAPLVIPATAIAGSRRDGRVRSSSMKRRKVSGGRTAFDPIVLDDDDDDDASVATLEEDRLIIDEKEEEGDDVVETNPPPTLTSAKGKSKLGALLSKLGKTKSKSDFVPGSLDHSTLPMLKEPTYANPATTRRLMKDFQMLVKTQSEAADIADLGWYIDPNCTKNMYQWIVELHSFDPAIKLAQDMKVKGHKSIVLELRFGPQYPMTPPFVRVIQPRFLCFQQGGGGHVTAGGAMCMELLTNDGWSAVYSIESVLIQVRAAMASNDPRPARLDNSSRSVTYGVAEAVEAYIRACNLHGWKIPDGFREFALGGTPVDHPGVPKRKLKDLSKA